MQLKNINNAPEVLYTKGNIELFNTNGIAIIGSRACSRNGVILAKKFARELAVHGITIISGMAKGIDTAAHQGALEVNGNTIAVLGNGFNHIFPKENIYLFEEIVQKGLVVTEYEENEKPKSDYFRERNRIVSGLSIGVLIIEAEYRSGTTITARLAKEQGKEVFCLPHAINDKYGIGTNRLIAKRDAKLITNTKEIIEEFDFLRYSKEKIDNIENGKIFKPKVKEEYQQVFDVINLNPIQVDEICMKTKKNVGEVNSVLMMLELEGYIEKISGGYKCTTDRK